MQSDSIDNKLDKWASQLPDLDLSGRHVIWRIDLVAHYLNRLIEDAIARYGLSASEFKVLLTLLRAAPSYQSTPTDLAVGLMTSGAMTSLIDRLETAGYVERAPDPTDGRGVLVRLTPSGREIIERAHTAYLARERELLSMLTDEEQRTLTALLRKIVVSLETAYPDKPRRHRPSKR